MGQKICDKHGNEIGTIKSEQEVEAEENWSAVSTILTVAVAIVIVLLLLLLSLKKPWVSPKEVEGFSEYWYGLQYLVAFVSIVVGRKILIANKLSLFRTLLRVVSVNTVLGTIGGLIAQLVLYGYFTGDFISDALYSAYLAILPAIIVAAILLGKRIKNMQNEEK